MWITGSRIFDETSLPATETFEARLICDVVDQSAAVRTPVKCVTQGLEFFLACCIPYLKRDHGVVNEHLFLGEIGSNRGLGLTSCLSVQILLKKRGLAYA